MPPRTTATAAAPIQHRVGCPAERIEEYEAKPPKGRPIRISRCVDCGEQATTSRRSPADEVEDDQEDT